MRIYKRILSLILVIAMVAGYLPTNVIEAKAEENTEVTENIEIAPLSTEIPIVEGVLDSSTGGDILESDIYGSIVNYQLKKGHTLSISDENYVFSVRKYADGNYATLLKEATTSSYTATEDMTVGMLIRKPDKSSVTAEELEGISIIDSRYGMIDVDGYEHAFTVDAETIDGGTAATRAAIFLPDSYDEIGEPTRLIIMTNGLHGHLTDSVWNANTADDVGVMKHYLDNDYAVIIVNNTANQKGATPDLGNPQLVSSYWKAYEYVQTHFNVEEMFSIHSRSQGTFAAVRLMREHPELVKCAVMCGAVLSIKSRFSNNPAFIAGRYGFDDTTGATWEADKVVGYDPYTDVDGLEYSLPPTFWMLAESDATTTHLSVIEKIQNHGNDVTKTIYSDTDHSGVCRLNIDVCKTDSLAFLEKHQESTSEHRFYAWKVAEKSTCTEEGEMRRYCVDCDYYETIAIPHLNGHVLEEDENICTICGDKFELVKEEIIIQPGQFDNTTKAWIESDVYGYVIDYELKAGHTLSISDTDYVFAVRILQDGQYQTMVREASSNDYTATEDMTVAIRVRKPDKSAITEEELQAVVLYDIFYEQDELQGKKISILGASISTYTGISNNAESNATIGNNAVYYTEGRYGVYANDTWWMQAANDLGMELLVNNSWSGSSLLYERSGTVGAYVDRCVQLHNNDGDEPDVIAIQMGTNDFQYYKDTLGTADIDYTALIVENEDGSYTYAEPVTSLEAAAIVLHKISKRYPNAEVYYLNISQRVDGTDALIQSFNAELKRVVEYFGGHIVDIYGSAITMEEFATYIGDNRVHPNTLGMDAYTEAFKRAIVANTGYEVETHTVSMKLDDVTVDYGDDKIVVNDDGFFVNLTSSDTLDVTVLMGEEDITSKVYADGTVCIDQVTADVTIYAKNTHVPQKYRWEFDGEELSAAVGENVLTKVSGTTTDGVFSGTCYSLNTVVVLQHDEPWAVEWKCEGTFQNSGTSSGARLFSEVGTNATYGVRYIFKSNKNGLIAMGEKTSTGSHNYGIALGDYDIDWTENHVYRLENRVADDGSNMIYLSVDGTEIGAMNHYYVGTTDKGTTSDWLSGKDFVFTYMGTDTHGFTNASIEYISVDESKVVWEQGTIASATGLNKVSTSRYRTVGYQLLSDYSGVSILEGYTMTNFVYDEKFNYLGTSSWLRSGRPFTTAELQETYPTGVWFRTVFRADDARTLVEEDIETSGVTFYLSDEEVPIPDNRFEYADVGSIGNWQEGAIWNGKLFTLGASGEGAIFDVETAEKLAALTLDENKVITPHANSVCFGNAYYAADDKYPLLYVNVYNNYASEEDRKEGTCCVYRIVEANGTFETELVQVIRIGFTEDLTLWKSKENNEDVRPYGNFVVDTDENKLYAYVMRDSDQTTRFLGFEIPTLDKGIYVEEYGCNMVTLGTEDIQVQFDTAYFQYLQGCCYSSGKIISAEGFGGDCPLRIVDLENQSVSDIFYLGDAGLKGEPEIVCVNPDDGTLYYAATDGILRVITLDDVHFHNYSAVVTAPICTMQGYTTYTCVCGENYQTPWLDECAYEGMTIACIGDSITAGVGVTADETDYVYLLSQTLGMDYIRLGASGTVLCTGGHRTCNINKLTESKLAGADIVTILMGINDFDQAREGYYALGDIDSTDTSTIYGAVRMWCEQIVELRKTESLTDTQFYFITPVITSWNHSVSSSKCWEQDKINIHGYTLRDLCNAIIEVCALYDIAVIDLNLFSGMYYNNEDDNNITEFGGDGIHPGTVGHEMMAEAISKALLQSNQRTDHEHIYGSWITTTYAGCENGEQKRVCSICTAIQSRTLEGVGHIYGEWEVTKDSTCTAGGTESRSCSACDTSETREIEKLGHNYKSVVTEATCTEQGYTTHTCIRCTDSFVDGYVEATGHAYGSWVTTQEATCTVNGSAKRTCQNCDAYETKVVTKLGHKYTVITTNPTCTEEGYDTHTCERCEDTYKDNYVDAAGHKYGAWTVTVTSTCTTGGTEKKSCSVCKTSETREIEKLGHNYKTTVTEATCTEQGYTTHTCTRCSDNYVDGYVEATGHTYGSWITTTEVTCTADGSAKRTCQNCDAYETKVVTKLGHSYTVITTAPTCTGKGYDTHTCERCGDSYRDNYVEAAGHNYKTTVTEPTCTEEGYTTHTCTRCADSFVDTYKAAVGHSYSEWITTETATCTADGSAKKTCQNCDAYETKVVTKLGHEYTVITTKPTCTEQGYDTHTCERCEDSYQDNYVDATGHSYGEWTVTVASTCTTGGTEKRSCTVCKVSETRSIEKLGHNYKSVVTEATCTKQGYTTHTCTRCSDSYVDTYKEVLGHSYGDWITTKAATCTVNGSAKRTCKNCDAYETKVVTKLGHSFTVITTAPTCTGKGYDTHTCERCEDTYKDNYVDAAGHKYGAWTVTVTSTCTTGGTEKRSCSVCKTSETRAIEKLEHNYKTTLTAPTCTEQGYTTHTCTRCTDSFVDGYVEATGHSYGSWATTKAATCTTDGSSKRICQNCDAYETKTLTKLNHDYESEVTKPTCTAKGYTTHTCTRCSDSYVDTYTAAKGHNYSSWQTAKKASCTEEGVKTRRCLTCKITESKTIAKLNHDYVSVVTKPICTSKGYTTHTCTRCKDTYKDNYVAKLAHSWEKDVTIDRAATAEKSGSMSVHCADCSAKKAVTVIPKIDKVSCVKKRLYTGNLLNPSITVKDANGNKLVQGTDYTFVVYNSKNAIVKSSKNIGEYQVKINFKGKYSGTETLVYQIVPKAPEKLTLSLKAHDDIKVTWSRVKEATGYYVYYKQSAAATYKLHTITSSTTTVIKDLKDNVKYDVKIVPYGQSNGMKIKSKNAIVKTIRTLRDLAAPKTVTLKLTGHNDIKVTWSKVANAKGYYVYYKKAIDSKYKSYKVTTETSLVLKNLTDDTKYNIKIVPYGVRNSVKVTSDQYKVKSIRTLENLKAPAKLQLKATGKTVIKASWSKASDAKGYYVYYKVAGANGYKLYKTTTGTSITITGLKKNTKYSVKVVPYGISSSLKVKSDNYVVKNMTTLKK